MFGYDFSFTNADLAFSNINDMLDNLKEHIPDNINIKYSTFSEMHEELGENKNFNNIFKGDMFVY